MVYGNFENTQPITRSFHLHLEVPAVCFLAHIEPFERITTDRTKWRHVRITNPIEQPQNQSGELAGKDLLEIHAAGFALAACARTDHEGMRRPCYGLDKLTHERGDI